MNSNMEYIIYLNSFVDYKKYRSYGDVQQAIDRGEIIPDHPAHKQKCICKYCKKEFYKNNPWDDSEFCCKNCYTMYVCQKQREVRIAETIAEGKPRYYKNSGPIPVKVWEHIEKIAPLYNDGRSDVYIGCKLGFSDKYILKIRKYFGIPANWGKPPTDKVVVSELRKSPNAYKN